MSLAPTPSAAHILNAPLPRLLTDTHTELVDSSITDEAFLGAAVQRKSGDIILAMPPGRSEMERDTMARYLLARVFRVALPKSPPPFATTEL
ncbi:hypothetical protein U9R90_05300 [Streptomyces sp. E11-3]|uniref:hypothetical protein n=1 Tax=Streptomyces sp. E11-3 TaxID=3110112 RepID=UPI0039806C6F